VQPAVRISIPGTRAQRCVGTRILLRPPVLWFGRFAVEVIVDIGDVARREANLWHLSVLRPNALGEFRLKALCRIRFENDRQIGTASLRCTAGDIRQASASATGEYMKRAAGVPPPPRILFLGLHGALAVSVRGRLLGCAAAALRLC
jgi:hypothetical protein